MKAYGVDYTVKKGKCEMHYILQTVDAKDLKSARNKLARKHRVEAKDIKITNYSVVGYY